MLRVTCIALSGVVMIAANQALAQFSGVETFENLNIGDDPADFLPDFSNPFGDLAVTDSGELGSKAVVGVGMGPGSFDDFNRMQISMVGPIGHQLHKISADLYVFAGDNNQHIQVFENPVIGVNPTILLARYDGEGTWRFDAYNPDDSLIVQELAIPDPAGAGDHLAQIEFLLNSSTGDLTFSVNDLEMATTTLSMDSLANYKDLALTSDRRAGQIGMQVDNVAVTLIDDPTSDGDFNGDGLINAADYVVWRQRLGTEYDEDDYDVWRSNFGMTLPSAAAGSNTAIPEPSAVALLGIWGAIIFSSRVRTVVRSNIRRQEKWQILSFYSAMK